MWLFIIFTLLFIFFYFQDLSENHPGKRVSWLNIIIYIIIIIIIIIINFGKIKIHTWLWGFRE